MIIHVELFGLPGCGKSTVAHILANRLINHGYVVKEPSRSINSIVGIKKQVVKGLKTLFLAIRHPVKFVTIYKCVRENKYKRIGLIKQIINISIKVQEYLVCKPGMIIIWDEGIAQAMLSLVINSNCNLSGKYAKKIMDICSNDFQQINVYLKEDLDVIIHRLNSRETNYSRVEKIKDDNERIKMLNCFSLAADSLDRELLVLGNNQSPQVIADYIYDYLSAYLHQNNR